MELPLGGPALRHYTQSRPRPHRQKLNYRPSRPQETILESENEVLEHMGRVDEGVEEFFTKRVLPTDTLKKQDEETITVHEVAPASSVPCPPQTKTLRRKLGDFFTLKKRRGLKSETSHEGRPKKTSIADLIRPLREVARAEKDKDKDRVKEHDKENEKEKAKENPSAGESAVQETPVSGAPPLRGEAVPPRRALREGKSQSLILLSGSAGAGTQYSKNTGKKQLEGQHSFEQKLHLMLQRIGVSKAQPGEIQNQEGEMKKAESEGTIIDSKPEPPPTFTKPRTMSASSDTRHQMRPSVSAHESTGKPALLPKPVIKPGPPPTTSGRNTPENELAQIQEAESNTPTKQSSATSPPATPDITATTTIPTVLTISNSVSDSTDLTVSPSSTVPPSDTDICTSSVHTPAAATTTTDVTEPDSKPSIPEAYANTPELPASTSTATPIEPSTTVSVTSTSSEPITTLSLSTTSSSTTTPAISTSETVSAPSNENQVSTASTDLQTEAGIVSVDSTPTASVDAAVSATTTAQSPSTCTSDTPPILSTCTNLITAASDNLTSGTSASRALVASPVVETSPPPESNDTIATPVSPDASISSSSTLISSDLPPTTTAATITSPISTDYMDSSSTSTITQPATSSPADLSTPSTSSTETNPTDTTTTTISINHSDSTSTSSSAATAAISSPPTTDSDPPYSNSVSTTLTPTISDFSTSDNSNAASHHLTAPVSSKDSPGPDKDSHTSSEDGTSVKLAEKDKADEEHEMLQKSEETKMDDSQKVIDCARKSEDENEKNPKVNNEVMSEDKQEQGVKIQEDTIKAEVGMAEPALGKDVDESRIEVQKQEETKAVVEK